MSGLALSALHRYPVKSLGGETLAEAQVERHGLDGDRRWLVVDETGRFQSQRELRAMTQLGARWTPEGLLLTHAVAGELRVAVPKDDAATIPVVVWRDTVPARLAASESAAFLSAVLGKPLRLVYQHDVASRPVDPQFSEPEDRVSFADGYPQLLTTEASLADLNSRLAQPVAMRRFRPNLVIAGATPWAEDGWRRIRIGTVIFRIVKPCARCVITTLDPETGTQPDAAEPLKTLAGFHRASNGGICFGQNLIPQNEGVIRVGDAVEILETGPSNLQG